MRSFPVLILLMACAALSAAEWPQWRGPANDGSSEETNLPDHLDSSTSRWAIALPGVGCGTPAVWGDHVFVSAIDAVTSNLVALCVQRADGVVRWQREVGVGFHPQHPKDIASQSPTCDGEVVVFAFGTGDLAAFGHDGTVRWKRNLQKDHGKFTNQWVYGSSPLLHQGRLYVQVLQTNPDAVAPTLNTGSYILCIDPATGKDVWKHPRPTNARGESQDSYASPIPLRSGDHDEILIFGGDCLTGHDAVSGQELWRFGGWNPTHNNTWRMIPTPVVAGGHIVICTARGNRLVAVKAGGSGDISATHQVWDSTDISTDIAVPLQYHGRLYVLHGDRKILACLDPATGAKLWEGPIDSATVLRASPTAGDGKIYCVNESGDVWVIAADAFRILSTSALGSEGETRASIALAHGEVFVRTADKLHAFGKR